MTDPDPDSYLAADYPYLLARDVEAGGFFAEHADLEGCASQGDTADEAVANLDDARQLWIETRLEDGLPVPNPVAEELSGRTSLRIPVFVHAELARHAERCGLSLNKLLNNVLSDFVGWGCVTVRPELLVGKELGDRSRPVKDGSYYSSLNYPYELVRDEQDGGFVAEHPDLEGCFSEGDTADEAVAHLDEARELWIETRRTARLPVPVPLSEDHTGYISLRTNRPLHGQLARHAVRNGVSLNQFLAAVLAGFAGAVKEREDVRPATKEAALQEGTTSEVGLPLYSAQAPVGGDIIRLVTDLLRKNKRDVAQGLLDSFPDASAEYLRVDFSGIQRTGEPEDTHLAEAANVSVSRATEHHEVRVDPSAFRDLFDNFLILAHERQRRQPASGPIDAVENAWLSAKSQYGQTLC